MTQVSVAYQVDRVLQVAAFGLLAILFLIQSVSEFASHRQNSRAIQPFTVRWTIHRIGAPCALLYMLHGIDAFGIFGIFTASNRLQYWLNYNSVALEIIAAFSLVYSICLTTSITCQVAVPRVFRFGYLTLGATSLIIANVLPIVAHASGEWPRNDIWFLWNAIAWTLYGLLFWHSALPLRRLMHENLTNAKMEGIDFQKRAYRNVNRYLKVITGLLLVAVPVIIYAAVSAWDAPPPTPDPTVYDGESVIFPLLEFAGLMLLLWFTWIPFTCLTNKDGPGVMLVFETEVTHASRVRGTQNAPGTPGTPGSRNRAATGSKIEMSRNSQHKPSVSVSQAVMVKDDPEAGGAHTGSAGGSLTPIDASIVSDGLGAEPYKREPAVPSLRDVLLQLPSGADEREHKTPSPSASPLVAHGQLIPRASSSSSTPIQSPHFLPRKASTGDGRDSPGVSPLLLYQPRFSQSTNSTSSSPVYGVGRTPSPVPVFDSLRRSSQCSTSGSDSPLASPVASSHSISIPSPNSNTPVRHLSGGGSMRIDIISANRIHPNALSSPDGVDSRIIVVEQPTVLHALTEETVDMEYANGSVSVTASPAVDPTEGGCGSQRLSDDSVHTSSHSTPHDSAAVTPTASNSEMNEARVPVTGHTRNSMTEPAHTMPHLSHPSHVAHSLSAPILASESAEPTPGHAADRSSS